MPDAALSHPDLPGKLGIPAKWCGYAALPRPRIRSEPSRSGCVYALPEHLEPRPVRIGRVAAVTKGSRRKVDLVSRVKAKSEPPPPSFRDALGSSFKPSLLMSEFLETHRALRTQAALVAETAKNRTELMRGVSQREGRLAPLRKARRPTKGIFGRKDPPWQEGQLRALERARDRLVNPRRWALLDQREEADKKAILKRRVDKHSPRSAHLRRVNAPPFPPIHPPAAVLARTTGFSGGHTLPPNNNFNQGSLSARSLGAAPTTDHRGLAPPRLVVRPSHQGLIVPSHPPVAEMKPALPRYAENHSSTIGNKVASQVAGKLPPRGTPSTLSVTSRNSPATSETASVPSHTPIIQLVDPDKEKRKSGGSHSSQVSQPSTIQYQPEGPVTSALPHYSPRRGSRFEALFQDALNRQERQRVRKEERERVEEEELYRKGQSKTRRPFSMAKFKQCVDDDVRQRQERKARREAMRIQEKNNKDKEAVRQ
ncbi:hypothetical protein FOZ62_031670 [Perkinsus olseni]|uniref:Uncharacterized protein n=1 Tax=Perkinsus olseni TaxID=32597 RepID=A0A7J6S2B1_PEROL|nr:hypothetical protein FOZ62_031670 [Perkinsus olseni]